MIVNVTTLKPGDTIELGGVTVLIELVKTLPTGDIELWYSRTKAGRGYNAGIVVFATTAEVKQIEMIGE